MVLPESFQFSQGSLQDFVDCRRRFYLRYVRRLAWPAIQAEPVSEKERNDRLGAHFHRMVQQNLIGIPPARISAMIHDRDLEEWWQNYLKFKEDPGGFGTLLSSGVRLHPETTLVAPLAGYNLIARCDLVVTLEGKLSILVDWKTGHKLPRRDLLAARMQTRVYPYLLVRAGTHLNGGEPVAPEQVEMIYWFAAFPGQPERFCYSPQHYQDDEQYLCDLISQVRGLEADDYYPSTDANRSRLCVYRSLCDHGITAGGLDELESEEVTDNSSDEFNFDQAGMIAF